MGAPSGSHRTVEALRHGGDTATSKKACMRESRRDLELRADLKGWVRGVNGASIRAIGAAERR
jgi:hypothetical protein